MLTVLLTKVVALRIVGGLFSIDTATIVGQVLIPVISVAIDVVKI